MEGGGRRGKEVEKWSGCNWEVSEKEKKKGQN